MSGPRYADLRDAGRVLAAALGCQPVATPGVLGLPRGGVVCPLAPTDFRAVGQAYADFSETTDAAVVEALRRGGTVD